MTNLIRWQTHRYVLRQSVAYFANDFAGRIASNIIQSAASLRDSVVQVIDALWFVTVFAFSALFILAATDWRLGVPLALWICGYVATLGYFVPRIRKRSQELAHKRATLTGRIVDSYTNIQTVKLFAHLEREDEQAREAIVEHTDAFHRQTRTITWLNLTVSTSNSALLTIIAALCVLLWRAGAISLGDVAVATGLALRVVTMSGWVMWTAIGIFDNVGQVQEGMRTIARPRALVDRPGARALVASKGAIAFERVRFHYGKQGGVIDDLVDQDRAGREGRAGRPLGRGQVDARQPAAALLRRRGRPRADRRPGHSASHAGQPAPADRHGHAGHFAAASIDRARTSATAVPTRARPT